MTGEITVPAECAGAPRLSIGGTSLHTPAWWALNTDELLSSPNRRGDDRIIPGNQGRDAMPRYDDPTTYSLRMIFGGAVDSAGTPYADPWVGLETNRRAFAAAVVALPGTSTQTRVASLAFPGGSGLAALTGDVHVERLTWKALPGALARATLAVSIPRGTLL